MNVTSVALNKDVSLFTSSGDITMINIYKSYMGYTIYVTYAIRLNT